MTSKYDETFGMLVIWSKNNVVIVWTIFDYDMNNDNVELLIDI